MSRFSFSLLLGLSLFGSSAWAGYFNCSVIYDEFESLMNNQFLVDPGRYVRGLDNRITHTDFTQLQRGRFQLYPERADYGIAIFQTNHHLHGKLLYRWSEPLANGEVHVIIEEAVLFSRVADGYGPLRIGPVRIKPRFSVDLDTGQQFPPFSEGLIGQPTQEQDRTTADVAFVIDDTSGDGAIEAVNGAMLFFPTETMCHRPEK